jgi:hypothetical protein
LRHKDNYFLPLTCIAGFFATHFLRILIKNGKWLEMQQRTLALRYALALVGLFNVFGTYISGALGQRMPKRLILSFIYFSRALVIAIFISTPLSPTTVYIFSAVMGLLWLSTVPATNAAIAQIFGVAHLSMLSGFVFLSHQVGSFLGVWLGGYFYDRTGNYDDRDPGSFAIYVASKDSYAQGDEANDDAEYVKVYDSAPTKFSGRIIRDATVSVALTPVAARYVKLVVTSPGAAIDEVEVYGASGLAMGLLSVPTGPTLCRSGATAPACLPPRRPAHAPARFRGPLPPRRWPWRTRRSCDTACGSPSAPARRGALAQARPGQRARRAQPPRARHAAQRRGRGRCRAPGHGLGRVGRRLPSGRRPAALIAHARATPLRPWLETLSAGLAARAASS